MTEKAISIYEVLKQEYDEVCSDTEVSFELALSLAIPMVYSLMNYKISARDIDFFVKKQPASNLSLLNSFREKMRLPLEEIKDEEYELVGFDDL